MSRGELSKNDISPYILLLYVGFFSILFLIVGYTIYSLVTRKDLSFIFECFDFSEVGSGLKLFFYFWELLFLAPSPNFYYSCHILFFPNFTYGNRYH